MSRSNPVFLFRVAGGVEIHSTQNPRLKNFEFEELENGGCAVEVDLWDGDYELSNTPALREGVSCSWRFGYFGGPMSPIFRGTIIQLQPTFSLEEGISLTLRAVGDSQQKLMRGIRRTTWQKPGGATS